MAERSYPTSEVRGSGLESQAATAQEQPRGASPRPRPGATAKRSHLVSEARVEAGRSNLTSKEPWLHGHRRASRSHLTLKVRKVGGEEIPILQGKEQWLHFTGAAVRRYFTPKVRETQVRL